MEIKNKNWFKKLLVITIGFIVTFGITFSPYGFSLGATKPITPINLTFIEETPETFVSVQDLLSQIEKSRGQQINGKDKIQFNLTDNWNNANAQNYDAFVFPINKIDQNTKNDIQTLVNSGKIVYIYGQNMNLRTAEQVFGVDLLPQLDNQKIESIDSIDSANNDVIGIFKSKNGGIEPFKVDIQVDEGTLQPFMFVDLILDHIYENHLRSGSLFQLNKAGAVGTRIAADLDNWSTLYVGTTKVATLQGDYWLWQEKNESDPTYDYFSMESGFELINWNGAENQSMYIKHDLPFAVDGTSDEIEDWNPYTTSGSSWTISLPWGIGWTFNTADSVAVTNNGSTSYDWADWVVEERWWQTQLVSPALFKPGTAWASTGTYAGIDVYAEGNVWYNNDIRSVTQTNKYRYDY